jgi:hypothetical protein
MIDAYHRLAALAARARDLATAGRLEELAAVHEESDSLQRMLPAVPPAAAESPLRAAATATAEAQDALGSALRDLAGDVARLDQGRRAVRGYAATGSSSPAPRR